MDLTIFNAVDGLRLSDEDISSYSRRRALLEIKRPMPQGDLGCALSHLRIYQEMVKNDLPEVIVFEDDAVPSRDLPDVIEAVRALSVDWDVVTFNSLFESARPRPIEDRRICGKYSICRYEGMTYGAQGYLIRLSAARRLLKVGFPVCMPPDDLLFRSRPAKLQVLGIDPTPLVLGDFRSELEARPSSVAGDAQSLAWQDQAVVTLGKIRRRGLSAWDTFIPLHRRR